ncbi:hypothetical protein B566_EDAN002804 [Ephemera danica]|nr:hypothetical protein B566_EDAN002804 [Ephemera danica]
MTNIRPMTQAKYQLLLESRRTLLHAKWPIIIMTTLALGLIAGSLLVAFQLSRNIHFKSWYELTDNASYHMKRAEFYSMATVHQAAVSSEPMTSALPKDKNQSSFPANHHLVCYYAIHDSVNGSSIQPEDIDPYLCTHIIIAFAHVANCTLQPLQPGDIEVSTYVKLWK